MYNSNWVSRCVFTLAFKSIYWWTRRSLTAVLDHSTILCCPLFGWKLPSNGWRPVLSYCCICCSTFCHMCRRPACACCALWALECLRVQHCCSFAKHRQSLSSTSTVMRRRQRQRFVRKLGMYWFESLLIEESFLFGLFCCTAAAEDSRQFIGSRTYEGSNGCCVAEMAE